MNKFFEIRMYSDNEFKDLVCIHYIAASNVAVRRFEDKFGRYMYFRKGTKVISMKSFEYHAVEVTRKTKPATVFFCE